MQITNHHSTFAISLANQMISERFGDLYGTHTWAEYRDFAHARATAHLAPHFAQRIDRYSTGEQRRNIKLTIEDGYSLAAVPMKDPRTNLTVYAEVPFGILLDLIELGADGSWSLIYKSTKQKAAQVRLSVPLRGQDGPVTATVARIIANAKYGQQARLKDHNPLNLRRANIYIVGRPGTAEGRAGTAKTDTRSQIKRFAEDRASLAGKKYGNPDQ